VSLSLKRIVLVVDKNFETYVVVLVVSQTKAIILYQESVVAQSIRVKKLISLAVACPVATIHSKVNVFHGGIPPLTKLFKFFD